MLKADPSEREGRINNTHAGWHVKQLLHVEEDLEF